MDLITLARKPKVIDLDEYGIGELILGLMSQGGGDIRIDSPKDFWQAVNTKNGLRLRMVYTNLVAEITGITQFYNSGKCVGINFAITASDATTTLSVNVSIVSDGSGTFVVVTV